MSTGEFTLNITLQPPPSPPKKAKIKDVESLPYTDVPSFNVAKYHLGKVKLELMQPASMPFQLITFRQAKHELMQPAVSPLGNT